MEARDLLGEDVRLHLALAVAGARAGERDAHPSRADAVDGRGAGPTAGTAAGVAAGGAPFFVLAPPLQQPLVADT